MSTPYRINQNVLLLGEVRYGIRCDSIVIDRLKGRVEFMQGKVLVAWLPLPHFGEKDVFTMSNIEVTVPFQASSESGT